MSNLSLRPAFRSLGYLITATALLVLAASTAHAGGPAKAPQSERKIRSLIDQTRKKLELPEKVSVEIVESNPLKASVQPIRNAKVPYKFSIERAFLAQLSEDELKAVVAHELGHVWIYTHHPYLQTEQLANKIALRVTTIDTLVRVYGKVWSDETLAGNLPRLPDQPQTAAGLGKNTRANVK